MSTEQHRQEGGLNRMTPARRAQQSMPEEGGAAPSSTRGARADESADFGDAVVVAVDGPAGSGKSSVSREAARRLDFEFLDTGAAPPSSGMLCWARRAGVIRFRPPSCLY